MAVPSPSTSPFTGLVCDGAVHGHLVPAVGAVGGHARKSAVGGDQLSGVGEAHDIHAEYTAGGIGHHGEGRHLAGHGSGGITDDHTVGAGISQVGRGQEQRRVCFPDQVAPLELPLVGEGGGGGRAHDEGGIQSGQDPLILGLGVDDGWAGQRERGGVVGDDPIRRQGGVVERGFIHFSDPDSSRWCRLRHRGLIRRQWYRGRLHRNRRSG